MKERPISPSTGQVDAAYQFLKQFGVDRWNTETALKLALNDKRQLDG